jgi:hypothetical protein
VATFKGPQDLGPLRGRDQIAAAYEQHPPSSPMRVEESRVDGDTVTGHFIWVDAPETGGVFVLRLRDGLLAGMDVTLDAPPPPERSAEL